MPVGLGEDQAAVPRAAPAPCPRHISGHATERGGGNPGIRNVGGRAVAGSSRRPHPCRLLRQTGLPPAKTGGGDRDGPKCLMFLKRYREKMPDLRLEVSMDSISPPPSKTKRESSLATQPPPPSARGHAGSPCTGAQVAGSGVTGRQQSAVLDSFAPKPCLEEQKVSSS